MLGRTLPRRLAQAKGRAMNLSLVDLQSNIKRDAEKSVNTGQFRDTIFYRTQGSPVSEKFVGRVAPQVAHGFYVEHGRRPGKMPPREPIEYWAQRKLGDRSLWFVIARAIARRGTLLRRRPGYERGWAHFRETLRRRKERVLKYWRDEIARAIRSLRR